MLRLNLFKKKSPATIIFNDGKKIEDHLKTIHEKWQLFSSDEHIQARPQYKYIQSRLAALPLLEANPVAYQTAVLEIYHLLTELEKLDNLGKMDEHQDKLLMDLIDNNLTIKPGHADLIDPDQKGRETDLEISKSSPPLLGNASSAHLDNASSMHVDMLSVDTHAKRSIRISEKSLSIYPQAMVDAMTRLEALSSQLYLEAQHAPVASQKNGKRLKADKLARLVNAIELAHINPDPTIYWHTPVTYAMNDRQLISGWFSHRVYDEIQNILTDDSVVTRPVFSRG